MKDFKSTVDELRRPGGCFAMPGPVCIARSPGRMDVMGGNVDYTGGLVFQATIREATWAAAQLRDDNLLVLHNPQMAESGWCAEVSFPLSSLIDEAETRRIVNASPDVRWTSYVAGVFHLLLRRYPEKLAFGATVYIESNVPLNKGVSSSAAVEVSVMKAVVAAYGIPLAGIDLAEACQWVENVIAESGCGIMDQAAVVLGDEGHMLPLLCQPCVPYPLVRLPDQVTVWGIDSGVSHMVSGVEYEAARAASFMGYKMICNLEGLPVRLDESGKIPRFTDPRWNGYFSDIDASLFRSRYEPELPEFMSSKEYLAVARDHVDPFSTLREEVRYRVRACTRYAIEENLRIRTFVSLAGCSTGRDSDEPYRIMGELMYQSNWAYTECGLGCDAIDQIIELVREAGPRNGLFGAKVSGGGAGGTVVVLGLKTAAEAFRDVVGKYAAARGFLPYVFEGSSAGADRFGTLIVGN
jgi:L-arabinokinase